MNNSFVSMWLCVLVLVLLLVGAWFYDCFVKKSQPGCLDGYALAWFDKRPYIETQVVNGVITPVVCPVTAGDTNGNR